MVTIAIDPGSSSGAIAVHDEFLGTIVMSNMPDNLEGIVNLMRHYLNVNTSVRVVIENVGGSMPGNAARSARTFATHVGHLEGIFATMGQKIEKVTPQKWMHYLADQTGLILPTGMENKPARKEAIYQQLKRTYDDVKFTKRQADALGILYWAVNNK
jgi:hypothetical protein